MSDLYFAIRPAVLLSTLSACVMVQAQTFKDPALESLYNAERYDELHKISQQRVAAQPDDAQAVLGLALAALARDDPAAREQAIGRAQACTERQPKATVCHYAYGVTLGVQAMNDGLLKAARSASAIRDALLTAHEGDPTWFPARSALSDFYLMAPGMMGGSASKAAELARNAPRPEQVQALEGRGACAAKRYDAALSAFAAMPSALEPALAADAMSWAVQCGLAIVNTKEAAKAGPLLEKLRRDFPSHAGPAYALARVRGEAGAHEEALKLYEQAATLKGANGWPIVYRAGIELQTLGRHDAAKAAYTRFVASAKGPKPALEDARKRLEQLGG